MTNNKFFAPLPPFQIRKKDRSGQAQDNTKSLAITGMGEVWDRAHV